MYHVDCTSYNLNNMYIAYNVQADNEGRRVEKGGERGEGEMEGEQTFGCIFVFQTGSRSSPPPLLPPPPLPPLPPPLPHPQCWS